tara:strand:- start:4063 stop:4896 length:834 start_codon:yes stop_codon:yes gene_type:complete
LDDIFAYSKTVNLLRQFFQDKKGFIEVPAQSRLSILAACEDPRTLTKFEFAGTSYSLPQTGQMQLEHELMKNPDVNGLFCVTTSYRNEPEETFIPGRHLRTFPMFEFESKGNYKDLIKTEDELLDYLGFSEPTPCCTYDALCERYGVEFIEAEQEEIINKEIGNKVFIKDFPVRSDPFWNMQQNDKNKNLYNKVDVILFGQETIGSASRSTSPSEMKDAFYNISGGEYAKLLFEQFGEQRVIDELDEYLLSYSLFPRYGGGIGVSRMARALQLSNII